MNFQVPESRSIGWSNRAAPALADAAVVKRMNPMEYIGAP